MKNSMLESPLMNEEKEIYTPLTYEMVDKVLESLSYNFAINEPTSKVLAIRPKELEKLFRATIHLCIPYSFVAIDTSTGQIVGAILDLLRK